MCAQMMKPLKETVRKFTEIVENYFIDAYTETDCRYTIDVNSGLGPFAL